MESWQVLSSGYTARSGNDLVRFDDGIILFSHAVVEPEKGRAKICQNVICTQQTVFTRKDMNALAKRPYITRTYQARIAVNSKVKPRFAKAIS